MRLAYPSVLTWFLVVLIFFLTMHFLQKWNRRKVEKIMGGKLWPFLTRSLSSTKRRLKIFLQIIVCFFILLALSRPQAGESQQQIKSEGVELLFVVDVSESMLAEDVKPNRLEQVKLEMSRLIDLMPGNKVGVVAFAGSAALLCPLTNDPNAIKMYLESLSTQAVSTQGTSFEAALQAAEQAFERGGVGEGAQVTRAILIASDGEDHEPNALKMAGKLVEKGIRIFTLAYGTEKGGNIPQRDNLGYLRDFKKDSRGQPIITTVMGDALKELAKAGQGSFYYATFGGQHLNSLVEDFGRLEKTEFASQMATQYEEQFQVVLFLAVMTALIEMALGERRQKFNLWRGRFENPL